MDVNNVVESIKSDGPISKVGVGEGSAFLEDSLRKIDTMFWFLTVGTLLLISRSLVFTSCAFKSKCLNWIRLEIIQTIEKNDKNEMKDAELPQESESEGKVEK